MPWPNPGPGRPLTCTPEHVEKAKELAAKGISLTGIAGALGVTTRSVQRWCAVGCDAMRREEDGEELSESDAVLASFFRATSQGFTEAESVFVGILGGSSSQGAQFWLERRRASEYAKYRDRPDVVDREHAASQPVPPPAVDPREVLASLPTEVLEELLEARKRTE